ncbi:MAG: DNRLRE domain-containing protein, partial [Acidobacteria bacterium]|nr:DNRLRE domain-containing protein [Acidobacteriota bacterium]
MAPRARIHFLFGLALLLALTMPALGREQKILQKKTSAPADPQVRAADSWIWQTAGSTGSNFGGTPTLHVTSFDPGTGGQNQRTLVQFDLSSIPRSGIKLATLKLFMNSAPSVSRNYDVHRLINLWVEDEVSWDNRLNLLPEVPTTAWTTVGGGGDFSGAVTATTASGTTINVTLSWTVTSDIQLYFGGSPPSANYGAIIVDSVESANPVQGAIFDSKEGPTEANHPSLTVEFIQQVTGLAAVPGNGQIALSWSYPAAAGIVTSVTRGVLILRKAGSPIAATTVPTDGTVPTRNVVCSNTVGDGVVVFNSSLITPVTTFNDSGTGDNPDCPPANGTTYYYKVFTRDAADNYSANGADSSFAAEIMATPGATASTQQAAVWMAPTGASTLAPAGLIPSTMAVVGSNSNLLQGFNPSNGTDIFAPLSTGGAIGPAFGARLPVVEAGINSLGVPATFIPNQDNLLYAVDTTPGADPSAGRSLWSPIPFINPTGLTTNNFGAGAGVFVKSISTGSSLPRDMVIVGTRNGLNSLNSIVGIDANTGIKNWSVNGSALA